MVCVALLSARLYPAARTRFDTNCFNWQQTSIQESFDRVSKHKVCCLLQQPPEATNMALLP
jgi:hypothetical protein